MEQSLNELKREADRALRCLYIAADLLVAEDVNNKVKAYIDALEKEVSNATS